MSLAQRHHKFEFFVLLILCVLVLVQAAEDFYNLLGVERDADNRDIRKAFKKIALKMHPDKNKEDPEAHEKFLRLNRAYEVLKDAELRKKYDLHGEKGLDENEGAGQYQSWNFYHQDFGIYDDDANIVTLSRSDFEQSVRGTSDMWFINFYSPRCGHCHDLAPDWRELATELEGVIRVGSVNCLDDNYLCNEESIRSYPSLVLYPGAKHFDGRKIKEKLVEFVLRHLKTRPERLTAANIGRLTSDKKRPQYWLVSACGQRADCLEEDTMLKLAAILEGVGSVASIDCSSSSKEIKLCEEIGVDTGGVYFFQEHDLGKERRANIITSLDTREVADITLALLPQIPSLTSEDFQAKRKAIMQKKSRDAMVVLFLDGPAEPWQFKKLVPLLPKMQVYKMDCRSGAASDACQSMHIHKYPSFIIFKNHGGYEFYYGRETVSDLVAFAKQAAFTPVTALGPDQFHEGIVQSGALWVVDFFAPWCPPCMRLLPEFRRASRLAKDVHFGTVDCTQHRDLCTTFNIQSYPTTYFYNNTKPHSFFGRHTAESLVDFIQDIRSPSVITLDGSNYEELVRNKPAGELWIIDYFAPWCGPCQQLAPEWNQVAKSFRGHKTVRVGQMDCDSNRDLCRSAGVSSYPNIRLYPVGVFGSKTSYEFNNWFRNAESIKQWTYQYLPSRVKSLTHYDLSDIKEDEDVSWVVDFFAPWCGHCVQFAPLFAQLADSYEKDGVKFGKVDCTQQQYACSQAGVRAYPTVMVYPAGQDVSPVPMQSLLINHLDRSIRQTLNLPTTASLTHEDEEEDDDDGMEFEHQEFIFQDGGGGSQEFFFDMHDEL